MNAEGLDVKRVISFHNELSFTFQFDVLARHTLNSKTPCPVQPDHNSVILAVKGSKQKCVIKERLKGTAALNKK